MDKVILSLDEGTTSAKAVVFNRNSEVLGLGQCEFPQYYPKPGWIEQNPYELWNAQFKAIRSALYNAKISFEQIAAIGIANQRGTVIIWDKKGKPVYNAIVWQCRRTAEMMEEIKREYGELIKEKTGLVPDACFSASKIKWLLDNVPELKKKAHKGEVMFGTVDSFLIYKLTGKHVIDYSNASRTMLFDIRKLKWDDELLEIFEIPEEILPEVRGSSEVYGYTKKTLFGKEIPVSGDLGDQQAALFGQTCFEEGMAKATYGTGNYILANIGTEFRSLKNLSTTIAWRLGKTVYALEGSVFAAGAAIQWLKEDLKIIKNAAETEEIASKLASNDGVYFVPAFVGLGAPYWDSFARGLLIGITRGTKREHIIRAVLEAIAYLTRDVIEEMEKGISIKELRVDGGVAKNNFLMQFQADILGKKLVRPVIQETTALGVAYMAGLAIDYWESLEEVKNLWKLDREFEPKMSEEEREKLYRAWREAVKRALGWTRNVSSF